MNSATHPTFTIHGDPLNEVHQFTYLGSILTSDCDLQDNEVQYADDAAIPSHAAAGLQCSLDLYSLPHISVCVDSQHKENGSLP